MNSITICGRLGGDPELGATPSGKTCCRFSVADDRPKDKDGNPVTQWFNCMAYDKTADLISQYFVKGKPIQVIGKLSSRLYEKRAGGVGMSLDVQVASFDFVPFGQSQQNGNGQGSRYQDPQDPAPPTAAPRDTAQNDAWDDPGIEDPFKDE
jgi:single-strand DNA-binding protein